MGRNYMPEVAKMLGLEIGEEFDILYDDGSAFVNSPFKFTNETILDSDGDELAYWRLFCLLTGKYTLQKRPRRPTEGEPHWLVLPDGGVGLGVFYKNNARSLSLLNMGNCFPTAEVAETAVPEMLAKFEEIRKGVGK